MKIRNLIVLSLIGLFIGLISCRDDFDFDPVNEELTFSNDTLRLDTVFNYSSSQTYKFAVYNGENKDVLIPKIRLSRGESSLYKLNVDGMPGYEFTDVAVRKKDSIFIFVEISAGEAPTNPDYEDEIIFETANGSQEVKLMAYILKAKFYNSEQNSDYPLNESWDNEYARVVYGNLQFDALTVGPGTRIYFHNEAGLTVNEKLTVNGSLNNKVVFRTDRMDERSDSLPNMWGKIHLKNNMDSKIDYAVIKGGNIGLEVENSTLEISNTRILNNEKIGLYGKNSTLRGENMVISNSDLAALAVEGGDAEFIHSSFSNYFNIGLGSGNAYSLYLGNTNDNGTLIPLTQANFYNCVFYGRASNAVILDRTDGAAFNYDFKHNIIRLDFPDEISGIDNSNVLDKNPAFINPGFGKNDLRISSESEIPALNIGSSLYAELVPLDILNQSRIGVSPLPGAFQQTVNPEE